MPKASNQFNPGRVTQVRGSIESRRSSVAEAIRLLGCGFLAHPANAPLRARIRSGALGDQEYYGQLIRIGYRLIVLFTLDRSDSARGGATPTPDSRRDDSSNAHRLRSFARGALPESSHGDLWYDVSAVFNERRTEGDPPLGVPPLAGFLWSPGSTPDLLGPAQTIVPGAEVTAITNADLLAAMRLLADAADTDHGDGPLNRIGHIELGSIYESLLALHPRVNPDAADEADRFTLAAAAGSERKTSGSYYTPHALVQSLLDSALEPAVAEAIEGKSRASAEAALLDLRICDPACGAGYFLVAAARRLASTLAGIRADRGPITPAMEHEALRDVVDRCIYGVDVDPMAAELCRIGLWLEVFKPGAANTLVGARIRCGNSLLGATPQLLEAGIPHEAFERLPGDDARVVAYYKKRNRRERLPSVEAGEPASTCQSSSEHRRLLADAWCAAFVWRKHDTDAPGAVRDCPGQWDAITESVFRRLATTPDSVASWIIDEVRRIAAEHRFFHWSIEFPEVFARSARAPAREHLTSGENGDAARASNGFDVVLGNPPFLNQLETATATARGLAAIAAKRSGDLTRGYTDLSAAFLLLGSAIARPGGRVALVQPQAVLAVKDAAPIRKAVLHSGVLEALWVSNEHIFEGASVFTCAPTIRVGAGRSRISVLRRSTGAGFVGLADLPLDNDALASEETWAHLAAAAAGIPELSVDGSTTLASLADATADFRDQYYGLDGYLIEDSDLAPEARADFAAYPPIVTTGLIDLAECRWGLAPTRILKTRWSSPRLDRRRMEAAGTLGPWMAARLVPKVLLATQTRVMEVFVDVSGRYVPSIPLITMTSRQPERLWHIGAALASPVCSVLAMQKYAGAAMTVDAIKLSAKQVLRMPVPSIEASEAWDEGAAMLRAAQESRSPNDRRECLLRFGDQMCRAYELPAQAADEVMAWWSSRLTNTQLPKVCRD